MKPLTTRLIECALWLRTAAGHIVSPVSLREEWLGRARACEEAAALISGKMEVGVSMEQLKVAARKLHDKKPRKP
jgi:hypothetical protein